MQINSVLYMVQKIIGCINFMFGKSFDCKTVISQVQFFFNIPFFVFMPIYSINFNTQFCFVDIKINAISSYLCFLRKAYIKCFEAFSNFSFNGCLPFVFSVARNRTKSVLITHLFKMIRPRSFCWKLFSTCKACCILWVAKPAFARTINSFFGLFANSKYFATFFACYVYYMFTFTFQCTIHISIRVALWYRKRFSATNAYLGNGFAIISTFHRTIKAAIFSNICFCPIDRFPAYFARTYSSCFWSTHKDIIDKNNKFVNNCFLCNPAEGFY